MKRVSSAFHRRPLAIVVASVAVLAAGVAVLRAAHTPPSTVASATKCDASQASPVEGTAGMRIAIDPATGQLTMPIDAGVADLTPAGKAGATATVETLADGTQILHTNGQFRHYATVQLNQSGKLEANCAHEEPATLEVR